MGVLYAIHAVDPKKVARTRDASLPARFESVDALRAAYRGLGIEPSADCLENFEPGLSGELAALFLQFVTVKSWDLDKALADFALGPVFDHVPELRELHPINGGSLNHHKLAINRPAWVDADIVDGALGPIWPAEVVETWLPVVSRFATRESVAAYQFPKPGLLRSLFAKPGNQKQVLQKWQEAYTWDHWEQYLESIRFCSRERACWGLCIIP